MHFCAACKTAKIRTICELGIRKQSFVLFRRKKTIDTAQNSTKYNHRGTLLACKNQLNVPTEPIVHGCYKKSIKIPVRFVNTEILKNAYVGFKVRKSKSNELFLEPEIHLKEIIKKYLYGSSRFTVFNFFKFFYEKVKL